MPKGYSLQIADPVIIPQQIDSVTNKLIIQDSVTFQPADTFLKPVTGITDTAIATSADTILEPDTEIPDSSVADTLILLPARLQIQVPVDKHQPDTFYLEDHGWNFNRNFLLDNPLTNIHLYRSFDSLHTVSLQNEIRNQPLLDPELRAVSQENWLTVLMVFILILFIWIRILYGKIFSLLADSLKNYQISAKLFLERNILTRRFSLMLDVIYFVVFAVFLFELVGHYALLESEIRNIYLFGMILSVLVLFSVTRIGLLRLTGFVFNKHSLFAEYIHHTFIFNKGLGIALFPVIATVLFIPPGLITYILISGMFIYLLTFILKALRAYKIIIRKDILLFYLILYLCTLEILPLLLGYKVMKSLILSY